MNHANRLTGTWTFARSTGALESEFAALKDGDVMTRVSFDKSELARGYGTFTAHLVAKRDGAEPHECLAKSDAFDSTDEEATHNAYAQCLGLALLLTATLETK